VGDRREVTRFDHKDFTGQAQAEIFYEAHGADDPYLIDCVSQLEKYRSDWISALPKDENTGTQRSGAEAPPQVLKRGMLPSLSPWQAIPSLFVTMDRDLVTAPVADFAREGDLESRSQHGIGCSAHVQVTDAVHPVAA